MTINIFVFIFVELATDASCILDHIGVNRKVYLKTMSVMLPRFFPPSGQYVAVYIKISTLTGKNSKISVGADLFLVGYFLLYKCKIRLFYLYRSICKVLFHLI